MDDTFDQLDQAAVAGADGNPWPIPDLPSVFPSFSPHPTPFDPFPDDSTAPPSLPSAPIPVPTSSSAAIKLEPLHITSSHPVPVPSSPQSQPSLCSVDSLHSSASRPLHLSSTSSSLHKFSTSPLSSSPTSIAQIPSDPKVSSSPSCPASSVPLGLVSSDAPMPDVSPSPPDLTDLTGTTAARSRKMTDDERKIMLHKRRLRNRASAARSREKRSRTLNELTTEVVDLMRKSARLADQVTNAVEEIRRLHARNVMLAKENQLLKSELQL